MHSTATHPVIVWIFESKPKGWTACLTGCVHCPDRTIPRATLLTRLQTQSAPFSINVLCCVTLKYTTLKSCFLNYLSFLFSSFFFSWKSETPETSFMERQIIVFLVFGPKIGFVLQLFSFQPRSVWKQPKKKQKKTAPLFSDVPPRCRVTLLHLLSFTFSV